MVTQVIDSGALEILHVHSDLAPGSLRSVRAKFAESQRHEALKAIITELEDGSLYLGDVTKGEIQIVGLARILTNRFWMEVEYSVLFPPKTAGGEPVPGSYRVIRWNAGVENGAAVLPITSTGDVVLTKMFRHATRSWCIEAPRGIRKPDEAIEQCGLREAGEESGVSTTAGSQVSDLGTYDPDTGALMSKPRLLAVTNCEVDEGLVNRDVSEAIAGTIVLPAQRVWEMIESGEITDGFTIAVMTKAALKGTVPFKR